MTQVAIVLFLFAVCQAAPQLHHLDTAHHVPTLHHANTIHHVPAVPLHHGHHGVSTHHQTIGTAVAHHPVVPVVRHAVADHGHAHGHGHHVAVVDEAPKPYAYGYESPADGGSSSKQESSDGAGRVTGSYSVTDEDGRVRKVDYYADETGFHANVQTNEQGTANQNPADVQMDSTAVNEPVAEPHVVHHATPVHVQPVHHNVGHHPTVVYRRVPVVAPHGYDAHHGYASTHHHQPVIVGGHHLGRYYGHGHPLTHHRSLVPVVGHHH